ncbi:MAG: hypothetical protein V1847_05160 [Candidatus Diapherotrites archaeon]
MNQALRSISMIAVSGAFLFFLAVTLNVLFASALVNGFLSGSDLFKGWAASIVQDVVRGGSDNIFVGASQVLVPWEFVLLLAFSLLAGALSFYFSGKVLHPMEAQTPLPKRQEKAIVQVFAALVFFALPFIAAQFSFSISVTLAVLELVFWPLEYFVQKQKVLGKQQRQFTVP